MSLFNQDTIQRLDKRIASKIDDGDLLVGPGNNEKRQVDTV